MFYRDRVLLPFIKCARSNLYGWVEGTPIPIELTAVCWCDGACVQLLAVVNETQQLNDEKDKIITNKHSAARTAVEKPCDLPLCFMSLRTLSNHSTRSDLPAVGLQRKIKNKFTQLKRI